MSVSPANKLRATERTLASVTPSGCLRGVLAGVGSIPVVREAEEDVEATAGFCCELEPIPRRSAAFAVPSAVKAPEALRTESMAGMRFFRGEVAGVEKESDDFRDARVLCEEGEDEWGEGVRLFARWDEMRADFLGE